MTSHDNHSGYTFEFTSWGGVYALTLRANALTAGDHVHHGGVDYEVTRATQPWPGERFHLGRFELVVRNQLRRVRKTSPASIRAFRGSVRKVLRSHGFEA